MRFELFCNQHAFGAPLCLHHASVLASASTSGFRCLVDLVFARQYASCNWAVGDDPKIECAGSRQELNLGLTVHQIVIWLQCSGCWDTHLATNMVDVRNLP